MPDEDSVDRIATQWKREKPDAELLPMTVIGRISVLNQLIRPRLERIFAEHGINGWTFDVLATLRRSGAPYCLTPTALFNSMMLTSGAMTHRIDRLEILGLVERKPDPNDRRGIQVGLTAKGLAVIDRAIDAHLSNESRILNQLARQEQRLLGDLLRKLVLSLSEEMRRSGKIEEIESRTEPRRKSIRP